jgi:hypothetical protein
MTTSSRDLEILVAKIQKQLSPDAEVLHDVKLDGRKSNRKRQIDVLVRQRVGQYEILIIIDCKDYQRPVDVKGVEEFDGLLDDIGAQKGVLVCPRGFTEAAKTRAKGLQIELYSPVDTDAHKWQAQVTIPTICDFRGARISFGISCSFPGPFRINPATLPKTAIYDASDNALGTMMQVAVEKWNAGRFHSEPGFHEKQPIFDTTETHMDNGYDSPLAMRMPVTLYASLRVARQLFFGQFPIERISGFKDHRTGQIITNAFTVGLLSPDEVERTWQKLDKESDAPVRPALFMTGLDAWSDE